MSFLLISTIFIPLTLEFLIIPRLTFPIPLGLTIICPLFLATDQVRWEA